MDSCQPSRRFLEKIGYKLNHQVIRVNSLRHQGLEAIETILMKRVEWVYWYNSNWARNLFDSLFYTKNALWPTDQSFSLVQSLYLICLWTSSIYQLASNFLLKKTLFAKPPKLFSLKGCFNTYKDITDTCHLQGYNRYLPVLEVGLVS